MVLFVLAVNKGLCTTFRTVLVKMALVHKKPVNAQLFKGNYIVFTLIGAQFFQLGFQRFPGLFHLLDGEILRLVCLRLSDAQDDLIHLLLQNSPLPLDTDGYLLELTVPDDDGIVVAGGDAGAEFFAVGSFKVLAPCHQEFGVRIEIQKL